MEAKSAPTKLVNIKKPNPNNVPNLSLKKIKPKEEPLRNRIKNENNRKNLEMMDMLYTSDYIYEVKRR